MSSLNRSMLIGNIGKNFDIRYSSDGKPIAAFSLATIVRYKDKKGESHERIEWHRACAFNGVAKIFKEYSSKGSRVYVEGPLNTKTWVAKDGTEHSTTQIIVTKVVLLDGPNTGKTHFTDLEENSVDLDEKNDV